MQFEMLRLSMAPRRQLDAFEKRAANGQPFDREGWLRDTFSRRIQFEHRQAVFYYVPEDAIPKAEGAIFGRIGRQVTVSENEPPERNFVETERDAWRAALVIIDPTHHKDGQKVAVQCDSKIGKPIPIFESLAAKLNNQDQPFVMEANAIVPSARFWDFVESNRGEITFVEFEFVAPNMFGESDDYDKEMREFQQQEKAQKAKLSLEAKDGLDLNTPRVRRAADYTIKGAGSIRARTKTKRIYNSREKAQKETIPKAELEARSGGSLLSHIFDRIFRL